MRLTAVPNTPWGSGEHYIHPKSPGVPTYLQIHFYVDSTNFDLGTHRIKLAEEGVGEQTQQEEHVIMFQRAWVQFSELYMGCQ